MFHCQVQGEIDRLASTHSLTEPAKLITKTSSRGAAMFPPQPSYFTPRSTPFYSVLPCSTPHPPTNAAIRISTNPQPHCTLPPHSRFFCPSPSTRPQCPLCKRSMISSSTAPAPLAVWPSPLGPSSMNLRARKRGQREKG